MEIENPYIYKALDKPDETIRLIKILSTAPIHCQLIVVSLEHSPVFSALSYMWGDATKTQPIIVDGAYLPVTTNLAHALQDVHGQWPKSSYTRAEEDRWLWADAICINQKEDEEKNHQVPLMERIYSRAQQVFAWLGIENEEIREGLTSIRQVSNEISQLSCYTDITLSYKGSMSLDRESIPSELTIRCWVVEWMERYYDKKSALELSVANFDQVLKMFKLPYWTRIWALQEVVLARHLLLVSGQQSTSWSRLCIVMWWIQLFRTVYSSEVKAVQVFGDNWAALALFPIPTYAVRVDLLRRLRATKSDVEHSNGAASFRLGYDLHQLSVEYRATNPKDYVYGMRGISGVGVATDYSEDQTVAQTYEDFVSYWLANYDEEAILGHRPGYLWFLELAGIGFTWQPLLGLPSWAPNFVGVSNAQDSGSPARFVMLKYSSSAGIFIHNNVTSIPRLEHRILHCTGILVDRISQVGPKICGMYFDERSADCDTKLGDWLLWIFDLATGSYTTRMDFMDYVARVIFYSTTCSLTEGSEYSYLLLVKILLAHLEYVCIKRRNMSHETFALEVGIAPHLIAAATLQSHRWTGVNISEVITWWLNDKTKNELLAWKTYRIYIIALKRATELCLTLTHSSRLGIFPPFIQAGDFIYILKGQSLPVVLRKLDNGGYIHVGVCLIPDLMDGVDQSSLLHGEAQFEEISIH
jgi:hypothetical protein